VSSARLRPLATLRPVLVAGFGLALLLAGTTGCGVGQSTQMSEQLAAVNGANGDAGPIAVRNAQLLYPEGGDHFYQAGSDAALVATIANTGATEDELTSVTTPAAASVAIDGQKGLPAQRTLLAIGEESTTTGAGGLEQGEVRITLEDLAEDVKPGRTVPVTFLFRRAGEITVDVPIAAPEEARAESDH